MTPLALVISLLGIGALLLQSGSCLLHKDRPLSVGFLDFLLALLCLYVALSLYSTRMVVAPELGAIMVQGTGSRWLLKIALVATAMLPALCCSRIRQLNHWRSHFVPTLAVALAVGMAAASSVTRIDSEALESLRVYQYDVWWPLMTLWLAACFAGSILALLKTEEIQLWFASAAALIPPLAYFSLTYEDLPGPGSRETWMVLEKVGFVAAALLIAMAFTDTGGERKLRRRIATLLPVLISSVVLVLLDLPSWLRLAMEFLPLVVLMVTVPVMVLVAKLEEIKTPVPASGALRTASPELPAPPPLRRRVLPVKRLTGIAHAVAVPVIALCITDLFSFGWMNSAVAGAVLLCFWMLFAERLATGELDDLPQVVVEGVLQIPMLFKFLGRPLWLLVRRPVLWLRGRAAGGAKYFTDATGLTLAVRSAFLVALVMLVFTALDEARSYQRMLIEPFHWAGEEKSKEDISKSVSAGLINALGRMRRELRTDLTLAQRRHFGEHPGEERILQAGVDPNTTGVPIAESDDLQIAGVKIHLKVLTSPIQEMVRSMLGIRVVSGTLKKGPGGAESYVVWANSSHGDSWRETSELANQSLPENRCISPEDEDEMKKAPVDRLIDKLAFDVASSEPSFIAAGMTQDWPAFQFFRHGLKHWEDHETWQNDGDLHQAISCFKAAIRRDSKFAIAFYRLGLAMQHDGQPGSAVAAFRDSIGVNPDFIPGALAEASTLYFFNDYYPAASSALGPPPVTPADKKHAANRIWEGLLDLPRGRMAASEWQAVYHGVCLHAFDFPEHPDTRSFYLPYFYCRSAASLFSHLSRAEREEPDLKALQASALDGVGVALDRHRGEFRRIQLKSRSDDWNCLLEDGTDPMGPEAGAGDFAVWGSRTSHAALRLYRESLALVPADPVVRCHAANSAAFLAGRPDPMEGLREEAGAHVALAQELARRGHTAAHEGRAGSASTGTQDRAATLYRRALAEYRSAIEIDPGALAALVGIGDAFWQWKMDFLAGRASTGPGVELARQAEKHAREALRLAEARQLQQTEWTAKRVLAETILGQGRLGEATHLLDGIVGQIKEKGLDWDGLSQTLWDAAQARLCACANLKPPRLQPALDGALSLLDKIRTREEPREWQPFSVDEEVLDPYRRQSACPKLVDRNATVRLGYARKTIDYGASQTCDWTGVTGRIEGAPPAESYFLHVLGGSVDRRVRLDPKQLVPILLEAKETHGDYFARIENDRGEAVSADQPFDTYAKPEGNECARNRITLVFSAVAPAAPEGPRQPKAQTVSLPPQICPASDPRCAQVRPASLRRPSSGRGR